MPPVDKSAASLSGSQDVGNQLFCALLRTVGVEARLVCSLQPLAFGATGSKPAASRVKPTVYADTGSASELSAGETSAGTASDGPSTPRRKIIAPGRILLLGQPSLRSGTSTPKSSAPGKKPERAV